MCNIGSKIITFQHAELIYKWIERLEITDRIKNSYEFKLLFRGSRDGATKEKFHEICDNQSRTVTIVKVKDSNEIIISTSTSKPLIFNFYIYCYLM